MLKDGGDQLILPQLQAITDQLAAMGREFADVSMLARTHGQTVSHTTCLLYTSYAADDLPRVDLGGRRYLKYKTPTILTYHNYEAR